MLNRLQVCSCSWTVQLFDGKKKAGSGGKLIRKLEMHVGNKIDDFTASDNIHQKHENARASKR